VNSDIDISYLKKAAALLKESERVVALTGAGISTPSGIPDFRSSGSGLWDKYDAMTVASLLSFRHDPEKFFEWSRPLTDLIINAEPNSAHYSLVKLEEAKILVAVVTQNIDNLHLRAGSKRVFEVHGHLREATCIICFRKVQAEEHIRRFVDAEIIPRCDSCGGILKPDVVLFGEELPFNVVNEVKNVIASCDLMLVVGSSLEVTPVALFPIEALNSGAKLIIINIEPTYLDGRADVLFHKNAAEVLPRLVDEVLHE
jgi:NAD-dependent deacetylase